MSSAWLRSLDRGGLAARGQVRYDSRSQIDYQWSMIFSENRCPLFGIMLRAGIFPLTAEISPYDFEERVKSAARAGFTGIGLWHTDLEHGLASMSLREMRAILDDNGIRHLEVEFLEDWFLTDGRKVASDRRKKRLFELEGELAEAEHALSLVQQRYSKAVAEIRAEIKERWMEKARVLFENFKSNASALQAENEVLNAFSDW